MSIRKNILQVHFNAQTVDGEILKDIMFTPSMITHSMYIDDNKLYITDSFLFESKYFTGLTNHQKKDIFTSSAYFTNFFTRILEQYKINLLTNQQVVSAKTMEHNIQFVLNLLFPKNASMVLGERKYKINNFVWKGKYLVTSRQRENLTIPLVKIDIDLYLHEGTHLSFIDSTRLHCSQKYNKIMNNYNYLRSGKDIPIKKTAPIDKIPVVSPRPLPTTTTRNQNVSQVSTAQSPMTPSSKTQIPIATPISNMPSNVSTRKTGGRKKPRGLKKTKKSSRG